MSRPTCTPSRDALVQSSPAVGRSFSAPRPRVRYESGDPQVVLDIMVLLGRQRDPQAAIERAQRVRDERMARSTVASILDAERRRFDVLRAAGADDVVAVAIGSDRRRR